MKPNAWTAIAVAIATGAWGLAADAPSMPDAQRRPTFADDIAPIVHRSCAPCHRPGRDTPFSLLSYDDVRTRGEDVVAAIVSKRMPPWSASQQAGYPPLIGDRRLSDRQITAIGTWIRNGAPSGDLRRAPSPPTYPAVWPLGLPDITMSLPHRIALPGGGSDEYRTLVVPIMYPTDLWIGAIDYQSVTPGLLRRARFYLAPGDFPIREDDVLPGVGSLLGGGSLENYGDQVLAAGSTVAALGEWTPGGLPQSFPENLAIRAPAHSNLIVDMHLRPADVDAAEDGTVALYFAAETARRSFVPIEVPPALGIAARLSIPSGEPRFVFRDSFVLPIDVEAIGARGRANSLGRELTLTATPPGAGERGLLRIAPWNPSWPETYYFAVPVRLPRGTRLDAAIVFDNSADNPRNLFLPPRRVGWGRMTVGESAGMTLLVLEPGPDDARALRDAVRAHLRRQLLGRTPD